MGVTKLSRMMGTDPNLALSVLEGLGRSESGRRVGGMDPQRKDWARLQDWAEETSSSSSSSTSTTTTTTSGRRTPASKAPKPPQGPLEKTPPLRE